MSNQKPVFELQEGYEAIVHRAQKEMRKHGFSESEINEFTFQAMRGFLFDDAFDYLKEVLSHYFVVEDGI